MAIPVATTKATNKTVPITTSSILPKKFTEDCAATVINRIWIFARLVSFFGVATFLLRGEESASARF
jgi:hypothetical protein